MLTFYKHANDIVGPSLTVVWIGGYTFGDTTNDSILLLFHLSYYSIAFNIKLLGIKLTAINNPSSPYWKGIKQTLFHLRGAFEALGSIFSFPILFLITTKLVMVAFSSFSIIYGLFNPNDQIFSLTWLVINLLNLARNAASVLIILHAADMPVNAVCDFYF